MMQPEFEDDFSINLLPEFEDDNHDSQQNEMTDNDYTHSKLSPQDEALSDLSELNRLRIEKEANRYNISQEDPAWFFVEVARIAAQTSAEIAIKNCLNDIRTTALTFSENAKTGIDTTISNLERAMIERDKGLTKYLEDGVRPAIENGINNFADKTKESLDSLLVVRFNDQKKLIDTSTNIQEKQLTKLIGDFESRYFNDRIDRKFDKSNNSSQGSAPRSAFPWSSLIWAIAAVSAFAIYHGV